MAYDIPFSEADEYARKHRISLTDAYIALREQHQQPQRHVALFAIKTLCNLPATSQIVIGAGTTLDVKQILHDEQQSGQPAVVAVYESLEFIVRGWEYTTDLTRNTGEIVMAAQQRIESKIKRGYKGFCEDVKRSRSGEVDFGCWWTLHGDNREMPRWSVSWIIETGEVYAWAARDDLYMVLGLTAPKDEARAEFLLESWSDPDSEIFHDLTALAEQIQTRQHEATAENFVEKFSRKQKGR